MLNELEDNFDMFFWKIRFLKKEKIKVTEISLVL